MFRNNEILHTGSYTIGITTDGQEIEVRFTERRRNFSLHNPLRTNYHVHITFYIVGTACSFPGDKANGA
jgi:hypothetical protein